MIVVGLNLVVVPDNNASCDVPTNLYVCLNHGILRAARVCSFHAGAFATHGDNGYCTLSKAVCKALSWAVVYGEHGNLHD
jgi:hypothetical protein